MQTIRLDSLSQPLPPTIVTVGNFDGIHIGHLHLFTRLSQDARTLGLASAIVTFEPHTRFVTHPESAPPILTTLREKEILLESSDIDYLIVIPFTDAIRAMHAHDFIETILVQKLSAEVWVMGENHGFGHKRGGDAERLRETPAVNHISIVTLGLHADSGTVASSTKIRELIADCQLDEALVLLGHPYAVVTERIRGEKIGTQQGFPTLNFLRPPAYKHIPPPGIYAAQAVFNGVSLKGALYLGDCPTFGNRDVHFEFYSLDPLVAEPATGEETTLLIQHFIRPDKKFDSQAELINQIKNDVLHIKLFFKE